MVGSNWAIIQSPTEVEFALELMEREDRNLSFLTTTAGAYFELRKYQVECIGIHEFLSVQEYDKISRTNHARVENITQDLDSFVHNNNRNIPTKFLPFEAFESELKKFVDTASFYSIQFTNFFNIKRPTKIYYWNSFSYEETNVYKVDIYQQNSRIVSHLLQETWWKNRGVFIVKFPLHQTTNMTTSHKLSWRQKLKNLINPNRIELLSFSGLPTKPIALSKSPRLLIVGKCGNLFGFLESIMPQQKIILDWWTNFNHNPVSTHNLLPVSLTDTNINNSTLHLINNNVLDLELMSLGNNLLPISRVVSQKIQEYWIPNRASLLSIYSKAAKYFRKIKPIAALSGNADTFTTQIVRQAAQAEKIPFISFQHGGAYGYIETEWVKLSDLRADYYAGFGSTGCNYLNKLSQQSNYRTKALPLGWHHGKQLSKRTFTTQPFIPKNGNQNAPIKILYIPTGLIGNMRYGPAHDLDETEYCIKQILIIETILQIHNVELTVKIHPKDLNPNPIPSWINEKHDARLKVETDGKLSEILESIDIAVIDFPTTALIEIFAMGIPLIYLNLGVMKWVDEAETLFRKTAPWIEMEPGWEEKLIKSIYTTLKNQSISPQMNLFLNAYASLDFQPQRFWETIRQTATH